MVEMRKTDLSLPRVQERRTASAWGIVLLAAVGGAWPLLFPGFPTSFMAQVWFYAVFAISADVLMGYTGLFSLGHAAFFGIGAYAAALVALNVSPNLALTLPAAMIAAGLASLVIGYLVIRQSGVYFIMLTLAFAQMVYAVATQWRSVTGGSDGLSRIPAPEIGLGGATFSIGTQVSSYELCFVTFLVTYLVLRRMVSSPFGLALKGIRESPQRMLAVGYAIQRYKLAAFVLAGTVAGIGGALSSYNTRFVSIVDLEWSLSGLVMAMLMMGGMGRLVGGVIGAAMVLFIQNALGGFTIHWLFVLGSVFVILVLVSINGVIGVADLLLERVGRGRRSNRSTEASRKGTGAGV